jgi:hypothetical protein
VFEDEIVNRATNIVSLIRISIANGLLIEMEIEYQPYAITWEDLNCDEVCKELVKNNLTATKEKAYIERWQLPQRLKNNNGR